MATNEDGAKERPSPREIYASPIITVKIGPNLKIYTVHKALAAHYSAYFRRALGSDFAEAHAGVATLTDIEEKTFELFSDWLYTQKLPEAYVWDFGEGGYNGTREYQRALILLCVFADRFMVPTLETALKRLLLDSLNTGHGPYFNGMRCAAENLPAESPVLRMLRDTYCGRWAPDRDTHATEDDKMEDLPVEFLCSLIDKYARICACVKSQVPQIWDYHEPDEACDDRGNEVEIE